LQRQMAVRMGLIFLAAFLITSRGKAQEVRRGELIGANTSRRLFERAAKKQGRSDFVTSPYDGPGTQVRITFDPGNADVTLTTNREYGLTHLLSDTQTIARRLDRPRADYITVEGSKTVTADIELNKYLLHRRYQTDFDLDLAALVGALKASSLPPPIVIGVNPNTAERVTLQTGSGTRSLESITFYGLGQIPPDARLHFVFTPAPYAAPMGLALIALLLSAPILTWRAGLKPASARPARLKPIPVALDPDEVQRRYDQRKPFWIARLFPLLIGLPFLLARGVNFSRLMLSWQMLSPVPIPVLMFSFLVLAVLTVAMPALRRQRDFRAVRSGGELRKTGNLLKLRLAVMFAPLLILPLAMIPSLFPVYTYQQVRFRLIVRLSLLVLGVVGWIAMSIWMRRLAKAGGVGGRQTLTEGVWYEMVQEMAAHAGVSVRQVVLITLSVPNAFASIFRTVGLTTGLVEKLEPEEVRAVIAHEIGHLKARHPHRTFAGTVVLFVLILVGWEWLRSLIASRLSDRAGDVFNFPFLFVVVSNILIALLLGPLRRRREREADRFAVQWIGDSELVIRALTKVSQSIGNPARLKRSDEALSSHPSLQNRIDAIRRGA
jgi:Zn-dependent protease with chaperone function